MLVYNVFHNLQFLMVSAGKLWFLKLRKLFSTAWYIPGVKTPNVSSKFIGTTKSWLTILGLKNNLALLKSCGWKNWQTYVRNGNGDQFFPWRLHRQSVPHVWLTRWLKSTSPEQLAALRWTLKDRSLPWFRDTLCKNRSSALQFSARFRCTCRACTWVLRGQKHSNPTATLFHRHFRMSPQHKTQKKKQRGWDV